MDPSIGIVMRDYRVGVHRLMCTARQIHACLYAYQPRRRCGCGRWAPTAARPTSTSSGAATCSPTERVRWGGRWAWCWRARSCSGARSERVRMLAHRACVQGAGSRRMLVFSREERAPVWRIVGAWQSLLAAMRASVRAKRAPSAACRPACSMRLRATFSVTTLGAASACQS